jgi:hypothetical protein
MISLMEGEEEEEEGWTEHHLAARTLVAKAEKWLRAAAEAWEAAPTGQNVVDWAI